jgi:hypothetical protein
MFQLIYLRFTAPQTDRDAFAAYQAPGRAILANQQASPDYAFSETLQSTRSQNHPRARMMTADMIDQMNLICSTKNEKTVPFVRQQAYPRRDFHWFEIINRVK